MSFDQTSPSRRTIIKAAAGAAALAAIAPSAYAQGSDTLKVGVIGCGGRGGGAAHDMVDAGPGTVIVALGELFPDRMEAAKQNLRGLPKERVDLPDERCFLGFDAYKKVLATDVDVVILATPPAFRPVHIDAAIRAGKHVFAEKPCAVCPTGVRMVMEAAKIAKEKNLTFVAGTQRRHQPAYLETIKRLQDGAIGKILGGTATWCMGSLWSRKRDDGMTDIEWMIRNWLYFTWTCGDQIVEQHMHNIDVMNWAMGGPPQSAFGTGGRQVRTDPQFGNVWDHMSVEFDYGDGVLGHSSCRQQDNTESRIGETVYGTKGRANLEGEISGEKPYRYKRGKTEVSPYVLEHRDLMAALRSNTPLNEAQRVAESTMTAVMGRMSAYTGKLVKYEEALKSDLDLVPKMTEFGAMTIPAVPMPGKA